jgi:hypothetical protein
MRTAIAPVVLAAFVALAAFGALARLNKPSGGEGGGISPAVADATYLRLDTANDPLTGALEIPAGTNANPGLSFTGFTSAAGLYADANGVRAKATFIADTSLVQNNSAAAADLRGLVQNGGAGAGGQLLLNDAQGNRTTSGIFSSAVASGGIAHLLNTVGSFAAGTLFQVNNLSTEAFSVRFNETYTALPFRSKESVTIGETAHASMPACAVALEGQTRYVRNGTTSGWCGCALTAGVYGWVNQGGAVVCP